MRDYDYPMDVFADLLSRTHARGALFAHLVASAPWGLHFDDGAPLGIHAVLTGEAWLTPPTGEPVRLLQGDLTLLSEPGVYRLSSAPDAPTISLDEALEQWERSGRRLEMRGSGPTTALVCGGYRFEGDLFRRLLSGLPPVIHLQASLLNRLHAPSQLLAQELEDTSPGQQIVLDRLLDVVLIHALRAWRDLPDAAVPHWFRASDDPNIAQALLLMHEHPEHQWTIEELADRVGLSRATFAKRFKALMGEPPLTYLTEWRLQVAVDLLMASTVPLGAIAKRVGYGNEYAFSAAFKRKYGHAPGSFRADRGSRPPGG